MKERKKRENMDERLRKLSKTITNYSIDVKEGERVLISTSSIKTTPLIKLLIEDIAALGASAFVKITDTTISALLNKDLTTNRIKAMKEIYASELENYDSFISIVYKENDFELKNIDPNMKKELGLATLELDDIRINQRKWVLLNYPSTLDAYKSGKTTEEFYNFALDVMSVDYKKYNEDIVPLKELMEKTNMVRIVGPNTDISFSIKNMNAIPCCGEKNIPDGEIYSAPIKDSVNGTISYNTPCPYNGYVFNDVSLTFKDGKIINCSTSNDVNKLNEIFDLDEGARYVGEFAIGFNKMINEPMGDILYDEKIWGSIHFTPGRCYKDCDNGNSSSIHWDMVLIQTPKFGGGSIYFDDVLVRENGSFVLDELKHLN